MYRYSKSVLMLVDKLYCCDVMRARTRLTTTPCCSMWYTADTTDYDPVLFNVIHSSSRRLTTTLKQHTVLFSTRSINISGPATYADSIGLTLHIAPPGAPPPRARRCQHNLLPLASFFIAGNIVLSDQLLSSCCMYNIAQWQAQW